jgi:hypothetical protein
MIQLNNQIARLEMRSEQLRMHLQCLDRGSPDAAEARLMLFAMLQKLVVLKGRREQFESEFDLAA